MITVWALLLLAAVGLDCSGEGDSQLDTKVQVCPIATGECSSKFVGYIIYDRNQQEDGKYVEVTGSWNNLTDAGFHSGAPVVVIIPGYGGVIRRFEITSIKNELLKNGDMFVIIMDWSKLVPKGCFINSVKNVPYAGRCLADLVTALGRPQSGLHVIGISLGAHVPGSAADVLAPYKIPRITGLDPAFPLFWGFLSQRRLTQDDGQFVDVIHTNAFLKGHMLPLGHVDFYVNWGITQAGCGSSFLDVITCSHRRAQLYYAESINTRTGFYGCKISSYFSIFFKSCQPETVKELMGYHVDPKLRGMVILQTASQPPFALGRPKVEENDPSNN